MSEGGSRKWKLRNGWGKVGLRKTHHPNRCGRPQLIFKEQTAPDPSVLCPIKEQRCASRYGHPYFPSTRRLFFLAAPALKVAPEHSKPLLLVLSIDQLCILRPYQ